MHKRKVVQYLRKYIRDLKSEQISSRLLDGEFELRDVELEVAPLNELLVGQLPYTLALRSISCESVHVCLPWNALRSKPVKVQVGGCRASIEVQRSDDIELLQAAARKQRDAMADKEAKRSGIDPAMKFTEIKIAVGDGIRISVSSVEVTLVSIAPTHHLVSVGPESSEATPESTQVLVEPLPVMRIKVQGIALGPLPEQRGLARKRYANCTTLRRRLAIDAVQITALHGGGGQPRTNAVDSAVGEITSGVSLENVAVELVEWSDVGNVVGIASQSGPRMCSFPREICADVHVPHVDIHCSPFGLASLAIVARDAAVPPLVPIEALPVEQRYLHWSHPAAAAVLDAAKARYAARSPGKSKSKDSGSSKKSSFKPTLSVASAFMPRRHRAVKDDAEKETDECASTTSGAMQRGASGVVKTASSAGSMVRSGTSAAATGALKTAGAAGAMAQRASSAAATGAVASASVAANVAKTGANVAATKAQKSATAAATGAVAGASAAARAAQSSANVAANKAQKGATGALATAGYAAGRAAAGARLAERTAAAAARQVKTGGVTKVNAASRAAAFARQTASQKAMGAASTIFRGKTIGKLPWKSGGAIQDKRGLVEAGAIQQDEYEEEMIRQAIAASLADTAVVDDNAQDTTQPDGEAQADEPGLYTIVVPASVGDGKSTKSTAVGGLSADTIVHVVEVATVQEESRVRGRIESPPGWISLLNTESGVRLAMKASPLETDEEEEALENAYELDAVEEGDEEGGFTEVGDVDVGATIEEQECLEAQEMVADAEECDAQEHLPLPENLVSSEAEEGVGDLADNAMQRDEHNVDGSSSDESVDDDDFDDDGLSLLGDGDDNLSCRGDDHVSDSQAADGFAQSHSSSQHRSVANFSVGPPALTRRLVVHASVSSVRVDIQVLESTSLLLDTHGIDFSADVLNRLTVAEVRALEKLGVAPAVAVQAAERKILTEGLEGPCEMLGAHVCATVGDACLYLVQSSSGSKATQTLVFHTYAVANAPWLLTLRCSTYGNSGKVPEIQACVHGVRVALAPEALKAVESVAQVLQRAFEQGNFAAEKVALPALPQVRMPNVLVTARNIVIDLNPTKIPNPMICIIPCVCIEDTVDANGQRMRHFRLPSVPTWHKSVPAAQEVVADPDFNLYSYVCHAAPAGMQSGSSLGSGTLWMTERQWQAKDGIEQSDVLVPASEFMALSQAKLRAVELTAECDDLAEAWHASTLRVVVRETARRIPHVRELLDEDDGSVEVESQLNALQLEASSLEEDCAADQERLRECEREVALSVASVHASHLTRGAELCRQLDEERSITRALASVVAEQQAMLATLQKLQSEPIR